MLKRDLIATARVPSESGDGAELQLIAHGRDHMIVVDRNELMSTRMQFSEEQLAELTIDRMADKAIAHGPVMLIGGYGMGFHPAGRAAAFARFGESGGGGTGARNHRMGERTHGLPYRRLPGRSAAWCWK